VTETGLQIPQDQGAALALANFEEMSTKSSWFGEKLITREGRPHCPHTHQEPTAVIASALVDLGCDLLRSRH